MKADFYKSVISKLSHAYLNISTDGKINECNEEARIILDKPESEIIGKYIYELGIIKKDEFQKMMEECIEQKTHSVQINFENKAGTKYHFELQCTLFENESEKSIVIILSNTTKEFEHSNELEFMNSVFLETIDNSYRGLVIIKNEGDILYVNNRFLKFFNVKQKLVGQKQSALDNIINELLIESETYKTFIERCYKNKIEIGGFEVEFNDGRVFILSYEPVKQNGSVEAHIFFYNDITNEVLAKRQVVSQKLFYDKVIEDMPIEVVILDATDLSIVKANTKALENQNQFIWNSNEKKGSYIFRSGEEKLSKTEQLINKSIEDKKLIIYDDLIKQDTGVDKHYRRYISPYIVDGETKFVSEFGVDLTEIIESKNKLEKSESNMKALVTSLDDIVFELSINGNVQQIWTNEKSNFSISFEKLYGKSVFEIIGVDYSKTFKPLFENCIENRTTEYFDYKGFDKFYLAKLSPIILNDKVESVSILVKNISEQKRQEKLLAESEAKYRLISDQAIDLISMHNMQGDFTFVSSSYEYVMGYKPNELVGESALKIIPPEYHHQIIESLQILSKEIPTDIREFCIYKKDGTIIFVEGRAKAIFDENGNVTSCQVVCRDISKRKEAQEAVNNALIKEKSLNLMRTKLVSTVSHEFRTPLSTVLSSTELIELYLKRNDGDRDKNIINHLNVIKEEVERITRLMNDVLHLTKEDSNKTTSKIEVFNMSEICLKVIENSFSNIKDGRKVIYVKPVQNLMVEGDMNLIAYSLNNLLNNAFKYSEGRGDVELVLEKNGDDVLVKITDKGIGIPESDIPYLFNTFYRAKNTDGIPGTGLGLMIVKTFIERNNGEVSIESFHNKGTTATIRLPLYLNV